MCYISLISQSSCIYTENNYRLVHTFISCTGLSLEVSESNGEDNKCTTHFSGFHRKKKSVTLLSFTMKELLYLPHKVSFEILQTLWLLSEKICKLKENEYFFKMLCLLTQCFPPLVLHTPRYIFSKILCLITPDLDECKSLLMSHQIKSGVLTQGTKLKKCKPVCLEDKGWQVGWVYNQHLPHASLPEPS